MADISKMIDNGDLKTNVGSVLPFHDAVKAHEMLEGKLEHAKGRIVLKVVD
ncbi:zinc-binding dehydrogenase [Rhizobium sp. Root1220]|uniref:zinc-binding dehydrogenase n=1 Tax=Rhizobium sp. Root1220 TaxID=1736432 RepID=UPI0009E71597|nr:zinc-binding dehydrogenase [Rhizobium sp. Root1220]